MALEPAGYADKLGNRYEGRWTVRQLLCVLNETLRSVVVEKVGDDQQGVDLCVELPSSASRAEQCKIRNGNSDKWTIADLGSRGIFTAMKMFLDKSPRNEFCLVTPLPSTALLDLCQSARASGEDPEAYFVHQVQKISAVRRQGFADFCGRVEVDACDPSGRAAAFSYLKRFYIESWSNDLIRRDDLLREANTLVHGGDATTVIAVLADFAQGNLRKTLDAAAIWTHLKERGLHPRRLENDMRVGPAVEDLKRRFAESIQPDLIGGELIPRQETDRLLQELNDHAVVVLHLAPLARARAGCCMNSFPN